MHAPLWLSNRKLENKDMAIMFLRGNICIQTIKKVDYKLKYWSKPLICYVLIADEY